MQGFQKCVQNWNRTMGRGWKNWTNKQTDKQTDFRELWYRWISYFVQIISKPPTINLFFSRLTFEKSVTPTNGHYISAHLIYLFISLVKIEWKLIIPNSYRHSNSKVHQYLFEIFALFHYVKQKKYIKVKLPLWVTVLEIFFHNEIETII